MTTNQFIPAHPITIVDTTHIDPTIVSDIAPNVDPFGVVRTAVARLRARRDRRRLAMAEARHAASTRRVAAGDHRMRAEFEAHFFGF